MTKYLAYDTETTGFNIMKGARPFMVIGYTGTGKVLATKDVLHFKKELEDPNIIKIMHNSKFDILMMRSVGVYIQGTVYDTMIAMHLLDENDSVSLKNGAKRYLGKTKLSDSVKQWFLDNKIKQEDQNYADVPDEIMFPYAESDGTLTYELFFVLEPLLKEEGLWDLFVQECELVWCLADMFCEGLLIDVEYFEKLKEDYLIKADKLQTKIWEDAGEEFDIAKPKQLARILTDAGVTLPKTKTGKPSVAAAALEACGHSLVKNILEHRTTMKFVSTFIGAMLKHHINGLIHCELWAQGARTGRFSSSDPNLQNIPKPDEDKEGSEVIRKGFINKEGFTNFYFDYSQQEYRVFLDYIKEEELIRKVNEEKADFHDIVHEEMKEYIPTRKATKTFNFMLIYGGGAVKMASMLGLTCSDTELELFQYGTDQRIVGLFQKGSRHIEILICNGSLNPDFLTPSNAIIVGKALEIKEQYFSRFVKVKPFMKLVTDTIKWRGCVKNRFGRKRRLSNSESYKGLNALIQGGCADFTKSRMVLVHKFLKPYKSAILLQVHDELKIKIAHDEWHLIPKIREIMEDCHKWFKVNLDVDIEFSYNNWAEKTKWEPGMTYKNTILKEDDIYAKL